MRLLVITLAFLWPAAAAAQISPSPGAGAARPTVPVARGVVPPPPPPAVLTSPAGAFAASLVLPGAGQAALGLKRWVAYGLLEAAFWTVHLEAAGDFRRLRMAYRDLAWEVARLPTGPSTRRDGSWGYYETMSQYLESGAFDTDPGLDGVQPETDVTTYNGTVWELARGLFLGGTASPPGSSAYAQALDYYRDRAAGPDFLWSWTGRGDDLGRFRDLIGDADREARVRSTALGLVLANHLVSAVDALVVARLRAETGLRLESRIAPAPGTIRWTIGLTLPIPN